MVYFVYGSAELIVAFIMFKVLERDKPVVAKLNYIKAYREPLTNFRFMRIVIVVLFLGFSVFGSFTYSGTLIKEVIGINILLVGLVVSLFGIGTVFGGRIAPKLRAKIGGKFLALAGILGGISQIFFNTAFIIIIVGLIATVFITGFEKRKSSKL